MRLLMFAAGLATGYVLGARAGRDKYEWIAEAARQTLTTANDAGTGDTPASPASGQPNQPAGTVVGGA
jgi:hypothetical protein